MISGLWLAFKMWGGFGRIGAAVMDDLRYLLAHPMTAAAIVFAILWRVEAHESATAHRALVQCQTARKHDQDAAAANLAKLKAGKAAEDARRTKATKDTNDDTDPARKRALADNAGYATSHRIMWAGTPGAGDKAGDAGGSLPGASATPGSAEGPAAPVPMIAITQQAFDNCTLNRADLQTAVDWADKIWGPTQ